MKAHSLLALVALAGFGLAGGQTGGPCPYIYPDPEVGEYAELQLTSPAQGAMNVRFAMVGTESVDQVTHYWLEVISTPPAVGAPVIAQMLVPHYPFERGDIQAYIVQLPGQPPLRVPQEMMRQLMESAGAPAGGWREQCASASETGQERVEVPAGTFNARHFRAGGAQKGELWVADIPFGIVKMAYPDGTMELLSYGTDAASSLRGEPQDLEPPPPPGGG